MNERLKELRLSLGLTQTEFGARLGVSRAVISGIEYANNKPNEALVKLVCNLFSVREEWLVEGKGSKFINSKDENMVFVDSLINDLDNPVYGIIRNIMECYLELDSNGKKTIEQFAYDIINKNSNK